MRLIIETGKPKAFLWNEIREKPGFYLALGAGNTVVKDRLFLVDDRGNLIMLKADNIHYECFHVSRTNEHWTWTEVFFIPVNPTINIKVE